MNGKIKLGVIGIGMAWDRLHYPALQKLTEQYEIAAVCNKTIDKARSFAQSISLGDENVYDDHMKLLERDDIEVVDILVPISENYEITKAAIQAGKHVIAEKPFASTPQAATELIELKNNKGVIVMVAENFRYDEGNRIIKELIAGSSVGEALYFIQNTGADFKNDMVDNTFAAKEWRQHPTFQGGVFLDGGIHDIARMRYLFGDIKKISACGRPQDEDYNEFMNINALIEFKNGVSGHYAFYTQGSENLKPPIGFRIFAANGDIYLENKDKGIIEICYKDGAIEQKTFTPGNGYYHELLDFHHALRHGADIISTPEKELGDIQAIFDIMDCCHSTRNSHN